MGTGSTGGDILGTIGAVIGYYVGGPQGAQIGFQIGPATGGYLDPEVVHGPRLRYRRGGEEEIRPYTFGRRLGVNS